MEAAISKKVVFATSTLFAIFLSKSATIASLQEHRQKHRNISWSSRILPFWDSLQNHRDPTPNKDQATRSFPHTNIFYARQGFTSALLSDLPLTLIWEIFCKHAHCLELGTGIGFNFIQNNTVFSLLERKKQEPRICSFLRTQKVAVHFLHVKPLLEWQQEIKQKHSKFLLHISHCSPQTPSNSITTPRSISPHTILKQTASFKNLI